MDYSEEYRKIIVTKKVKGIPNHNKMKATAYHEAGHALICLNYDLNFEDATIIPNTKEESMGSVDTAKIEYQDDEFTYLDGLDQEIIMKKLFFAGIISQAIYTGIYNWEGAFSDFKYSPHYYNDFQVNLQEIWDNTFNEISIPKNWILIERIAEYLFMKKKATRSELSKLISNL